MLASLLGFLGGLGIFLYGTHLLGNGLQKVGASKMREYLGRFTNTRIKGVLSGVVVTFFLQSSTVTNILVVGLVGGTIITLSQAFGIILGAAIGTTLTVQVLTFDVSKYATLFIFLGVVFIMFIKKPAFKSIGAIVLSIGFIFFGIGQITSSLQPLSENQQVLDFLLILAEKPILFALIAVVISALMHSSAAMIIIGIAFITSGVLDVQSVIPLVLGANIGSNLPVVISSLAYRGEGRKVGLFAFFFQTTGAIIFMAFLVLLEKYVPLLPGGPERQIAHFHSIFNIVTALLFFPFLPLVAKMFKRLLPNKEEETPGFSIKLDEHLFSVPEEALIRSKKEIGKLAQMVQNDMINKLPDYMAGTYSSDEMFDVERDIDSAYIKIQQYLLKLGQRDLTSSQSIKEVKLLNILNDIEHIGDMVFHFIVKAEQVDEKDIVLSSKDKEQLDTLFNHIQTTYDRSLQSFLSDDLSIARENIQTQSTINQFEKDVKFEHFNSLINKQEYNPNISSIYLDVVNDLLQVYHHSMNISRTVLGLI